MTAIRTAVIVGAGIAGPVTAIALQKAGIEAVVYEAHPGGAEGVGSFLTVASNGLDALNVLDARTPVLAAGFPTPAITLRSCTGKALGRTTTGRALADGTTSHTVKRADLYQVLYQEARRRGIRIEHGKRLTAASESPDGVIAAFSDGSEAAGDLLIGCDGVHSAIRPIIDPVAPAPAYLGLLNTGGYATGIGVDVEPGSYEMIFGRRAFFGYATAPSREVWWFANLPSRPEPTGATLHAMTGEPLRHTLLDAFAGDAGPAARLIEATAEISPATAIHALGHLPRWHTNRIIVIGDAAHAPSPTSGQGASLAIEDAVMLAKLLRDRPTPEAAVRTFETARRHRVERIVKWAARMSNSKAAGPATRIVRDTMMPVFMKMAGNSKANRETFGYHIDWDDMHDPAALDAKRT